MAMALVLNMHLPGPQLLRSVVLIPWAMAPVAVGILWSWIFDGDYGTLNALLFDLGLIHEPIRLARQRRRWRSISWRWSMSGTRRR